MVIAMIDNFNDCSFAIEFKDKSQKEQIKKYMRVGLDAWMAATNVDTYEGTEFTKEDVEGYYGAGFAEPTSDLLLKKGIEHKTIDIEYNEDGEVINADEAFYY